MKDHCNGKPDCSITQISYSLVGAEDSCQSVNSKYYDVRYQCVGKIRIASNDLF